jgi:NAD(P)H-dependent flavin oxidoreductase YrpB (nitropropane dioxygenase family)
MGPSITSPELATAVSNAGGLGLVSFGVNPPELLRALIRRLRELTARPFGVNMILQFPVDEHVRVCLEEKVPVLSFFWGDPSRFVAPAHAAGLKVIDQVGSVDAARRSAQAGVDIIIAQGVEAGGHIAGQLSTMALVPAVVDAIAPTPVVAAGGIADGRGVVAALALGAEGVALGTRFLATPEANIHAAYQQKVLHSNGEDTVRTTLFGYGWPNAPHRTLRTAFVDQWLSQEARGSEQRPDEPVIAGCRRHRRYRGDEPASGPKRRAGKRDQARRRDCPGVGGIRRQHNPTSDSACSVTVASRMSARCYRSATVRARQTNPILARSRSNSENPYCQFVTRHACNSSAIHRAGLSVGL